jgi:predicted alpha/beta hydrolase family esterase
VLLQPGIHNSGPSHWQSLWENRFAFVRRVQQRDWDHPRRSEWVQQLDAAIAACPVPPVLVAHSLGCLAAAHWCATSARRLHALVLVAVPDPAGPNFPRDATGFAPAPRDLGARRVTVVTSEDDPYSDGEYVRRLIQSWGAGHVPVGRAGHINGESGLGEWPFGWDLVRRAGGGEPV